MKSKRMALNRGTAVYLDGSRVRFIWPCGCTRIETVDASPELLRTKLVPYWRRTGVTLLECRKHPDYHNRESQVHRLNQEHPQ